MNNGWPYTLLTTILGLCWGSFLNVIAYRLVAEQTLFTTRSICPWCYTTIAWYDNIPLLSWFLLKARCRTCRTPISVVYPLIEAASAIIALGLVLISAPLQTKLVYGFFSSALLIATATDLYALVIPQCFTVWLIPVGIICAAVGWLPISAIQSMCGSMLGYGSLWLVGFLFSRYSKKEGLGIGDMELLSMIGSFLGPAATWHALSLSSLIGLTIGYCYLLYTKQQSSTRIPFGPFLALGALIMLFAQHCSFYWTPF